MAGLLDIRVAKKITVTCALEESTASQVDQYAAFAKCAADEVVNKALEYIFGKDKEFQSYRESHPHDKAPVALRVKKAPGVPGGVRRGRKTAGIAAVA